MSNTYKNRLESFERAKQELLSKGLTYREYQQELQKLADKYKV